MKAENTIKITFPALSRNEALARSVISAFAAQLDPTVEELSDIRSAVSEAITNAIVHGYRGEKGDVDMCAGFDGNRNLYIKIKDRGCGIKNVEQAMTPLFTTAPEGERAGLGFAGMEAFGDKVSVRSTVGKGTTVTLKKRLAEKHE